MRSNLHYIFLVFFTVIFLGIAPSLFAAEKERYDLVYIWGDNIESVLDYKENLESIFPEKQHRRIKIVKRGKEFGVIYDLNGTIKEVTLEMVHHGEVLRKAGLNEAYAIKDKGYHALYNVSYGLGPNLDALKKNYTLLYRYLGKDVGKDLCIIEISEGMYSLVYRRRGDQKSTATVARRHARTLKRKRISTSIIQERNNPVVFGEASHLDVEVQPEKKVVKKVAATKTTAPKPTLITKPAPKPKTKVVQKKPKTKKVARSLGGSSSKFESNIESFIKSMRNKGKISKDESTSWVVYDLERDKILVDINANRDFQAASMIKPFVALAFFHKVKRGELKYGPKSRRKMEAMIQRSSNSATNWVMRRVGGPAKCDRLLRREYGHIFKKTHVREYIPANGRTYKNSALPSDYVRFLRSLWKKQLPYSKELRRLMALPGRDRLYSGTPIPQGTLVYNKTGSTAHLCGDMGILVPRARNGRRYPYVIVGIIERRSRPSDYGNWMMSRGQVIRQVSTLVYKEMKKNHKLL
jgi:beta-lactamase class A